MLKRKRKLDAYRGRLSPAQIAAGINAADENARRLAADAEILLASNRFPTAASLAILAIEEAGKASVLKGLALARSQAEIGEEWTRYRSHTSKNVGWIIPELAAKGARKLSDLKPVFDESSEHPFIIDQVKQLGLYTDCLGSAHWSVPVDVVDQKLATTLVHTARVLTSSRRECTKKEVELWIEYVGPAWQKKDQGEMERAVIDWYAAMQRAGLLEQGPNGMEQFVRVGIQASSAEKLEGVPPLRNVKN